MGANGGGAFERGRERNIHNVARLKMRPGTTRGGTLRRATGAQQTAPPPELEDRTLCTSARPRALRQGS
eukprot:435024-Prymnesium_polylepis.1